jgi:DNA endonuclease activator SAE2/CtIP C-terminus
MCLFINSFFLSAFWPPGFAKKTKKQKNDFGAKIMLSRVIADLQRIEEVHRKEVDELKARIKVLEAQLEKDEEEGYESLNRTRDELISPNKVQVERRSSAVDEKHEILLLSDDDDNDNDCDELQNKTEFSQESESEASALMMSPPLRSSDAVLSSPPPLNKKKQKNEMLLAVSRKRRRMLTLDNDHDDRDSRQRRWTSSPLLKTLESAAQLERRRLDAENRLSDANRGSVAAVATATNRQSNAEPFAYVEIVRNKAEREAMTGYACEQCQKFYDAVGDGKRLVQECSRHRHRHAPGSTPPGLWNLGFTDDRYDEESL